MRTVHVIRHAYGTTVRVEGPDWSAPPRDHFLPTAASLRRLRRIVLASWKARAAQVTTYTELSELPLDAGPRSGILEAT